MYGSLEDNMPLELGELEDEMNERMRSFEEEVLKRFEICDPTGFFKQSKYSNLGGQSDQFYSQLATGLIYNFFDSNFLQWLTCSFKGTFSTGSSFAYGDVNTNSAAIQKTIRELVRIGEESAYGNVWMANFDKIRGLLLLKTSKKEDYDGDVFHEYFVGIRCLNSLRKICSNFMYVYGCFRCFVPVPQNMGNQVNGTNFCTLNPVNGQFYGTYTAIELIPNAVPWSQGLYQLELWEVYSLIIQLVDALQLAYINFGFVHRDLHNGNVLLRPLGKIAYVKLPVSKGWVKTRFIPTIIDYGMSRVTVEKRNFAIFKFGKDPDALQPEHDLYKILGFTMIYLRGIDDEKIFANMNIYKDVIPLFKFFSFTSSINDMDSFLLSEYGRNFELRDEWIMQEHERKDIHRKLNMFALLLHSKNSRGDKMMYVREKTDIPSVYQTWSCQYGICM